MGCPRSGTTLLQSLLGAHPDVVTFPESHVFRVMFNDRTRLHAALGLASPRTWRQFEAFVAEAGLEAFRPRRPRAPFSASYCRAFARMLDSAAEAAGKRAWLEKTPSHWRHAAKIQRHLPGTRFLHVVRSGPETVASLYEVSHAAPDRWGGEPWSIERCVGEWLRAARGAAARAGLPGYLVLRYEDVAESPELGARAMAAFLGLPYDERMLTDRQDAAAAAMSRGESWKQGTLGEIKRAESKLERLFSPAEQDEVRERVAVFDYEALPRLAEATPAEEAAAAR